MHGDIRRRLEIAIMTVIHDILRIHALYVIFFYHWHRTSNRRGLRRWQHEVNEIAYISKWWQVELRHLRSPQNTNNTHRVEKVSYNNDV